MGGAGTSAGPGHPDDPPAAAWTPDGAIAAHLTREAVATGRPRTSWGPPPTRRDTIVAAPPEEAADDVLTALRRALTRANVAAETQAQVVQDKADEHRRACYELSRLQSHSRVLAEAIDAIEAFEEGP